MPVLTVPACRGGSWAELAQSPLRQGRSSSHHVEEMQPHQEIQLCQGSLLLSPCSKFTQALPARSALSKHLLFRLPPPPTQQSSGGGHAASQGHRAPDSQRAPSAPGRLGTDATAEREARTLQATLCR